MNKTITLSIAAIIATAIIVYWFAKPSAVDQPEGNYNSAAPSDDAAQGSVSYADPQIQRPQNTQTAARQQQEPDDGSKSYEAIEERLEAMQQRRPDRHFDPAEVAAAVKREAAWATAEETPKNLPLEPEELMDGRQFINLDSLKIETLMPGDTVKVSIDETGYDYMVTVDNVEKHDYDSISWHGHIKGSDGQIYKVSFTRGESLTVGGLDTPEGHYVLQAHGNNGWLASSRLLFKYDPEVPDVIYPEDVEPHQHEGETH